MSGIWGPLLTEVDVDVAVVRTLRLWLPYYLTQAERERQLGIGLLARPREESFANTLEDDEFLDHTLPAIIVTTARSADVEHDGNGVYRAGYQTRVSAVVRGRTPPEARAVGSLFGMCVVRALVQHESLGGQASETLWDGGLVSPVDDVTDAGRYLTAAMHDFTVFADDVVQAGVGPYDPPDGDPPYEPPDDPTEPWDPLTSVGDVTVSVTDKETP